VRRIVIVIARIRRRPTDASRRPRARGSRLVESEDGTHAPTRDRSRAADADATARDDRTRGRDARGTDGRANAPREGRDARATAIDATPKAGEIERR